MTFSGKPQDPETCILIRIFSVLLPFAFIVAIASPVLGQSPVLDYSGQIGEKRPELLRQRPSESQPAIKLPAPPAPPANGFQEQAGKSIFVQKIKVTGSTVFTREELEEITAPYENRSLSMEDLGSLRRNLTLLYVNKGFVNSGAVIPDQPVIDGTVTLQIVEGTLSAINVEKGGKFAASYLQKRIALGAGTPLNVHLLQKRLQLLQQDPRIQRIQAELQPGTRPGEAELKIRVEEKNPISLWLAFNNYQSPTIGEERGITTLEHQNLTGHGDIFNITYGRSEGLEHLIDATYTIPVNAYDTTLQFRYWNNNQTVVDNQFGPLDIVSKKEGYGLTLRHPLYRSLAQEFALSLSIEKGTNENYLLSYPFSFSPGEEDGRYRVVPLRFAQEWTYRTQQQVIAARSRFSFGLDAFDSTIHSDSDSPDGKFVAWLGQLQYARILDLWDIQLLARADIQLANDSLFPSEQMGIGGRYSVRGYRENLMVRDQAFVASIETRIPLVHDVRWADYLHFCQFVDYGKGDNVDLSTPAPSDISSVGLGLRWGTAINSLPFGLRADAELYWGHQLRDVEDLDEGLQDDGIHYQIAITGYF